jgi:hypothetical protein
MVYAPAAVGARLALVDGSVRVSSDVHASIPNDVMAASKVTSLTGMSLLWPAGG